MIIQKLIANITIPLLNIHSQNYSDNDIEKYLSQVEVTSKLLNPVIYSSVSINEDDYLKNKFSDYYIVNRSEFVTCPNYHIVSAIKVSTSSNVINICLSTNLNSSKEIFCGNIASLIEKGDFESLVEVCRISK